MISLDRLWAVAWKETIHVIRDVRSLILALGMPLLLLFLFGYALSLDVDRVLTRFVDWDHTRDSHFFKERFHSSRFFQVLPDAQNLEVLEEDILAGRVMLGVVIPTDFMAEQRRAPFPPIQVLVDASDSLTSNIALGYVIGLTALYGRDIALTRMNRLGLNQINTPVEARPRIWYNPELESKNFIIPGLIAVISMIIAAQLTALTVAREWETGTMEWLIATPVKASELVLGKLIPYLVIGFVDILVAVAVGTLFFQVPLKGDPILLFCLCMTFLVGALSMGLLISIGTKAQLLASQVAVLTSFLPSFLLSGFVYPIYNMPEALQYFTFIVPPRYLIEILKGIFLKGTGLAVLWMDGLFLAIFALIMLLSCVRRFKKRLPV